MSADAPAGARRSPGGYVVEDSLARVGWDAAKFPDVALVETARPRRRAFDTVLCQNAWNFIPRREFRELLRPYPLKSRLLYRARRAVAALNVRRASRAVVLSGYMHSLLTVRGGRCVVVPTAQPGDVESIEPARPLDLPLVDDIWLIPGTLTWYKRPDYAVALAVMAKATGRTPFLVFAGGDDGSGCQQVLERKISSARVSAIVRSVRRDEMLWLLGNASVVLVPSRLESLSLSLGESLVLARRVAASDIPVHRELSRTLDREPVWLTPEPGEVLLGELYRDAPRSTASLSFSPGGRVDSWVALADELHGASRT